MTNKNDKYVVKVTLPTNETIELPIKKSVEGPDVVDVTKLYQASDMFTFDPGFMSTASCESKITYIDGDNGILRHRGYDIAELAEHSDFLEVAYLLINGELPKEDEKAAFVKNITSHSMIHEQLQFMFRGF